MESLSLRESESVSGREFLDDECFFGTTTSPGAERSHGSIVYEGVPAPPRCADVFNGVRSYFRSKFSSVKLWSISTVNPEMFRSFMSSLCPCYFRCIHEQTGVVDDLLTGIGNRRTVTVAASFIAGSYQSFPGGESSVEKEDDDDVSATRNKIGFFVVVALCVSQIEFELDACRAQRSIRFARKSMSGHARQQDESMMSCHSRLTVSRFDAPYPKHRRSLSDRRKSNTPTFASRVRYILTAENGSTEMRSEITWWAYG